MRIEICELWSDTFTIMELEAAWLEDSWSAEDYPTLKVSHLMKMALLLDRVANKTRVTHVNSNPDRAFMTRSFWIVIRTKVTQMKIWLTSYQLNVKMVAPSSGSTDHTLALVPTASGRFSKWYSEVYLLKTELSYKTIFKESIFKSIGQIIYATGHCVVSTAAMDSRLVDSWTVESNSIDLVFVEPEVMKRVGILEQ